MMNSARLLRRSLVRGLDVLLSLCTLFLSRGTSSRRRVHTTVSSWPRFDGKRALRAVLGYRARLQQDATLWLMGAVALGTAVLLCLHLELSLFNLVDRQICLSLSPPELTQLRLASALESALPVSLPSTELVVRAAYLDPRPRNGYVNATVFLVEARKEILARGGESIVACGVGAGISTTLSVRVPLNSWWPHKTQPYLTHDGAMIDCFGLPAVSPGSRAYIWYRFPGSDGHHDNRRLHQAESEQPYFVPRPKQTRNRDDLKIVVCMAIVRDFPPYMKDFLRHYKRLGVDHIYMTGEDSFMLNGIIEGDDFIRQSLMEGFISFSFWHMWLGTDEVFYHSQMLAHEDCMYRFQGTFDYALIVDSDDFFVPLVPGHTRLDYYIELYCRFGACIFQWLEYFPDCGQDWSRLGSHGNVTNTLLSHTFVRRLGTGKTIYRLTGVLDAGTHNPQQLLQGYKFLFVPPNAAYVAHIRKNKLPPGGLQSC